MVKPIEILIKARDEASSVLGGLQGKLTSIGLAIAGYFGISAFVGAVKGAADLEAKLSEVKAVSGATAAEMVLLRKAAEDAGATTKYTATEAADALGNLARAGLSAKDTIAALPAVLQLAQAGGIDLGRASEYITKTVMGMGLAFTDAGRVADVLAQGANASNTSVDGLAQALSYAAPLAKTLGLSLETTVAIIGKFADAGIDASRAGTALNAILAQFSDPASKFRTELAASGITTTNFEQALRQLAAAGPAGSKAINAVGTEAGPALRALLNQGIGALDDLKEKLDKSSGSAAELARIMNDNLNGATAGLGSAWDAVKNALATPVLPVLKDGVTQLSAAFTEAVSNGSIAKFGATIATSFESGIKWVKSFAGEVDFTALYARMQAFAADTQDTFTKIGDYATNAGNIVRLAYGVMSAGTNAVLTAVYGLGVAVGGIVEGFQKALALLYEGMAKITFGSIAEKYRQMAADVRLSAEATSAANRAMADKIISSFNDMGDSAQVARDGWTGLTADTKTAATQANTGAAAFKGVADALTGVGTAATDAGNKAKESADKQQSGAVAAKEKVATLRAEYQAAVDAKNWQLAVEKLQALGGAANTSKASTTDMRKKAEEDAAAIEAAFTRTGIKTKTQLSNAAKTAKEDFELIKACGQATAEGLQDAFKKYAEAAIAANGGVATEAIKSEAAMRGLQVQIDSTGRAILSAMGGASIATQKFGGHVRDTTEDIKRQEAALRALRLTSDGFQKNADGSAAGTFNNALPIDLAIKLKSASEGGQTVNMTQAEFEGAKKQASDALNFFQNMNHLSPGAMSVRAMQDAQALVNAANTARVNITDNPGQMKPNATPAAIPQQTTKSYTVNIVGTGNYQTDSDVSAQKLIALLQRAKLSA